MINLKKNYHRRQYLQKTVGMNGIIYISIIYIYIYIYIVQDLGHLHYPILKIKYKDCGCFLGHESVKDNLIKYKWLSLGTKIT